MTQKTLLSAGIASVLFLAVGVGVWRLSPSSPAPSQAPGPPVEATAEYRALARQLAENRARLAAVRRERDELADANRDLEAALATARGPATEAAPVPPDEAALEASDADEEIRWDELASLLADNVELLARRADGELLSPEEQAVLDLLRGELTKVAARAKVLYSEPLFDAALLRDLARTAFARSLGLDEEQIAALDDLTSSIVASLPEDAASLRSLDKHRLRQDLQAALFSGMEEILREEQLERWPTLRQWTEDILRYGGDMTFGVDGSPDNFLSNWVSNAIGATPASLPLEAMKPHAESFIESARELLRTHAPSRDALRDLLPEKRALLDDELLRLQRQFLGQVEVLLGDEHRKALRERDPLMIFFEPGRSVSVRRRSRLF